MRDTLMSALSDEVSIKSAGFGSGVVPVPGQSSRPQNVFCSATRAKGESKIICSLDVFDHNRIRRAVDNLPPLERRWILYRYGETPEDDSLDHTVELVFSELAGESNREDVMNNCKIMVERVLISRRNVQELCSRDLVEAMQVTQRTFFRRYKGVRNEIENIADRIDFIALNSLLTETKITKKVRYQS